MKVLLATGASYEPPLGGSTRANRAWLEFLAARGHDCRVVSPGAAAGTVQAGGVTVYRVTDPGALRDRLLTVIREFKPDHILVSTEDTGQALLIAAVREASDRVTYLAHTPQLFPFGPASLNPSEAGAEAVRAAARVIAIGRYTASYIEEYSGRNVEIVHPPMYGHPPYPNLGHFGGGAVGLINPCAVKGISLFLSLANQFPRLTFAALPGWGTTRADIKALESTPNVEVVPPCPNIDDFFGRIRVLLVPSLWHEGFGLVATEAMLRGIPVLAADLGGLPEAKLGVPYLLPVSPIEKYEARFDEHRLPIAIVPPQELHPWSAAIERLTSDRAHYTDISARSRSSAIHFVREVDAADFERALKGRLRILLVQNSLYYPAFGGGNKSNRLLMEALAEKGHRVRVITRIESASRRQSFLADLQSRGIHPALNGGSVAFELNGVEVRTETEVAFVREHWSEEVRDFHPSWTLVSSDDPAQSFLESALEASRGRVVYLCRTTLALPFGPDAVVENPQMTAQLRHVAGAVGVSEYVARYLREHGSIDAVHLPISFEASGPFPKLGRFDAGYVTMVNPCAIKGLPVFLELARRLPDVRFAAVPTWGTTETDLELLEALPNVTILPPADNIDDILRRTRVTLVPSLWAEARSRMVLESLLRGVPVLASDVGGIPEAMMGLDYLLPVNPIRRYRAELDPQMVPIADVPAQDVEPWLGALRQLLSERSRYETLAAESQRRAQAYVESIGVEPFEAWLRCLTPKRHLAVAVSAKRSTAIDDLSSAKRALLAARLRRRRTAAAPAVIVAPDRVPLSYAQERLVELHAHDASVNNVPYVRKLAAPDRADLEQKLNGIIERHEILRTALVNGEQRIHRSARLELKAEPIDPLEPFDLEQPPLFRAGLVHDVLTLVVHHAIADGWSSAVFARELAGDVRPVGMQYREWTLWQRQQQWPAQREYWLGKGLQPQPPQTQSYDGHRLWGTAHWLSFAEAFERWARILHNWSGEPELIIATQVANRRLTQVENTIGLFTNTLMIRSRRGESPRAAVEAALANQDYPFELLGVPMPRYLFVLQPSVSEDSNAIHLDTGKAEHDLRLSVTGSRVVLQYATDVIDAATAGKLLLKYSR